jgi:hypothetical protein
LVKNKESFNNLPPVPGMLSYREDNEKLYVNKGNEWDEIGSEKEVDGRCIVKRLCSFNFKRLAPQLGLPFIKHAYFVGTTGKLQE